MLIAADYPLLDVFWSIVIFFSWVAWIWIAITVISDVFRRHDIGGWGKAGWIVFVIVLPFLGVLIYLITQHDGMNERNAKQLEAARAALGGGPAAEIAQAKSLLDAGTISQQEFDAIKAKAISSG